MFRCFTLLGIRGCIAAICAMLFAGGAGAVPLPTSSRGGAEEPQLPAGFTLVPHTAAKAALGASSPDCVPNYPPVNQSPPYTWGEPGPWPGGRLETTYGSWDNCNAQEFWIGHQWIRNGYGLGWGGSPYPIQAGDVGSWFASQVVACNEFGCSQPVLSNQVWIENPPPPPPQCRDGNDNDGDGKTDWPSDPGCDGSEDNDEWNPPPEDTCAGPGVILYDGVNFHPPCLRVTADMTDLGTWRNRADSFRIVGEYLAILGRGLNYEAPRMYGETEVADLGGQKNEFESLIVNFSTARELAMAQPPRGKPPLLDESMDSSAPDPTEGCPRADGWQVLEDKHDGSVIHLGLGGHPFGNPRVIAEGWWCWKDGRISNRKFHARCQDDGLWDCVDDEAIITAGGIGATFVDVTFSGTFKFATRFGPLSRAVTMKFRLHAGGGGKVLVWEVR